MKHFRPEQHIQSQPTNDWAVIEAALAESDRAEAAYDAELKRDWERFPPGVRQHLETVRFYDGELIEEGPRDEDTYRLVLRTDNPNNARVELTYFLTEPPEVLDAGFPDDMKSEKPYWMYDEFEADPIAPRFTHSIVLSDGRELRVRFRDLEVRRIAAPVTATTTPA